MSVRNLLPVGQIDAVAAAADESGGFPWIWVIVIGAVVIIAALVLAGVASSMGMGSKRLAWQRDAERLAQDGLVILELAEPHGSPPSYGLETLVEVEDRLDRFLRSAGPIRKQAPSIRTKELLENLCHSGSTFAAAVAADRALRDGVTAKTAQHQTFSAQRVTERKHEFDLNLRELSWQLDELG